VLIKIWHAVQGDLQQISLSDQKSGGGISGCRLCNLSGIHGIPDCAGRSDYRPDPVLTSSYSSQPKKSDQS